MTTREHPHLATAAPWADEPLGPARRRQVLKACLLAREPLLELHDRAREVWPGHRRTVEPSPDGTGYAHANFLRCSWVPRSVLVPNQRRWPRRRPVSARPVRLDGGAPAASCSAPVNHDVGGLSERRARHTCARETFASGAREEQAP